MFHMDASYKNLHRVTCIYNKPRAACFLVNSFIFIIKYSGEFIQTSYGTTYVAMIRKPLQLLPYFAITMRNHSHCIITTQMMFCYVSFMSVSDRNPIERLQNLQNLFLQFTFCYPIQVWAVTLFLHWMMSGLIQSRNDEKIREHNGPLIEAICIGCSFFHVLTMR
jgi:hypothetical protein